MLLLRCAQSIWQAAALKKKIHRIARSFPGFHVVLRHYIAKDKYLKERIPKFES
jgi:hypothetical protein